jgi:hypothetical protein
VEEVVPGSLLELRDFRVRLESALPASGALVSEVVIRSTKIIGAILRQNLNCGSTFIAQGGAFVGGGANAWILRSPPASAGPSGIALGRGSIAAD